MRPADVPVLLGDSLKFRKQTGWQPKYKFAQTIKDIVEYEAR